jgi:hypothetical protein
VTLPSGSVREADEVLKEAASQQLDAKAVTARYADQMQPAVKITVDVGPDHVIKLPDEVPVGPAEIIVLVEQNTAAPDGLEDFEPVERASPVLLSDLVNEDRG